MPPLKNHREEIFCRELVNAKDDGSDRTLRIQAYQAAGYVGKTRKDGSFSADAAICQLLKNKKVRARIDELQQQLANRMVCGRAEVLNEMARIGLSDVRKVIGANGAITDPSEWDDDTAAAVAGIETEKLFEGKGKDREFIGFTQKVKLWDKNAALTNLAKHFKILMDEHPLGGLFAGANVQINMYLPSKGHHVHGNGHAALDGNGQG